MNLVTHVVGALATNCFVLAADGSDECAVIDPGGEGGRIVEDIRRAGLSVRYVFSTHGHADHTGAAATVRQELGGLYAVHEGDMAQLERPPAWITEMLPDFVQPPAVDIVMHGGEQLEFGGAHLEVLHTPGHTPGSVCFRYEDVVFTGDTLFRGSIGRHDLPGGSFAQEVASIRERLLVLDDAVQVMPGHGPRTTIGQERAANPFLQ